MTIQQQLESVLVTTARLEYAGDPTVRIFRNNVGMLQDINGKYVRYGLATGSSDLIGFKSVKITPDMVGQYVAIFVAAEGKAMKKYATTEQRAFIQMVGEMGGRSGIFRTVEEFKDIVEGRK